MRKAGVSNMFVSATLAQATGSVRATSRGAWSACAGQSKELAYLCMELVFYSMKGYSGSCCIGSMLYSKHY